jgi:hypothetical protein
MDIHVIANTVLVAPMVKGGITAVSAPPVATVVVAAVAKDITNIEEISNEKNRLDKRLGNLSAGSGFCLGTIACSAAV